MSKIRDFSRTFLIDAPLNRNGNRETDKNAKPILDHVSVSDFPVPENSN